ALLISFIFITPAVAQEQPKSTSLSEAEFARYATLRRDGLESLYNLEYEKARQDFQETARLYPTYPAGPQLLSAALWSKTLYASRRLQTSLYNTHSFYESGDDKVDPKVVDEFRSLTREAKRLCDVRLKQNPKDIEALSFLGNALGLKAAFEE